MATINPKKKRKGRVSSVVIFLIAFVLFLLVFGGLCLWAVIKIGQERRTGAASSAASVQSTVAYTQEDARNLFVVTTDGAAQGFLAVRADPANSRIRILAVPRDTTVDVGTSQQRLYELYAEQGVQKAQSAVGSLLSLEFDNYAVITYSNIERWINQLGDGLEFTLPENLEYEDAESGYSINLAGGPRVLTASQAVRVLRYPRWHGGRKQQADIQAQLLAAMLNQYFLSSRDLQADFDNFIGLLQTDIKVSHFVSAKPMLEYLASRNTGELAAAVSLEGTYVGSGDNIRFELADDAVSRLRNVLGNNL